MGRSVYGAYPGCTKYRYIYGKTRVEVSQKVTKAMADRDGGLTFDAGKLTIGEYLDRWLEDCIKPLADQDKLEGTFGVAEEA
jgi:integrase